MRVLHVTGTFLPVKGGGPYFVHYLTRHLEREGHQCHVVTTDVGGTPNEPTVSTTRSPAVTVAGAPLSPTFPVALYRAIRSFDPDVIHANYPLPLYPDVAALLASGRDTPLVLTAHGAFEMSLTSPIGVFGSVYNRTLLRVTLGLTDCVHVSNDAILEAYDFYRRAADTRVVPIGVDTDWFDPESVSGQPPYETGPDEGTVLYVGALRRYKGLSDLLDAFDDLQSRADAQLVVVGDGPRRERLQQRVRELGITEDVQFVGHVDDDALRRAYAHADVFVLPSPSIRESYGMVALEALAMGLPTVVTRGSGIGRVLDASKAGTVVSPNSPRDLADAIATLLTDTTRAAEESRAGRRVAVERFAWSSLVDDYVGLYRSVL